MNRKKKLILGAAALYGLTFGVSCAMELGEPEEEFSVGRSEHASLETAGWHNRDFRVLPLVTGDLVTYIENETHADSGYSMMNTERKTEYRQLIDLLIARIQDPDPYANWCAIIAAATEADYTISRFWDTGSSRYYVLLEDTGVSQGTVVINPYPSRDLIIEAPHVRGDSSRLEAKTAKQAAYLFRRLGAAALLLNGADRCARCDYVSGSYSCITTGTESDVSCCTQSDPLSDACQNDSGYMLSDPAHHYQNSIFHAHVRFDDSQLVSGRYPFFLQLHGQATYTNRTIVSDTNRLDFSPDIQTTSDKLAVRLDNLDARTNYYYSSCQDGWDGLCGDTNIEGRYTNYAGTGSFDIADYDACPVEGTNACNTSQSGQANSRFIHLEQPDGVITEAITSDTIVAKAMRDTFRTDLSRGCMHHEDTNWCVPAVQQAPGGSTGLTQCTCQTNGSVCCIKNGNTVCEGGSDPNIWY